jgi:hypothetical protein
VGDDVVELAELREVHARDVAGNQLEIIEAERCRHRSPIVDLHGRQVDTDHSRAPMGDGEGNAVASCRTTDLEHAGGGHLGRLQPEEMGGRRELPWR